MDMSSMDMSGGMDSSSDPMFRTFNQALAEDYWYIIAGILGFIVLLRAVDYYQTWSRLVVPSPFDSGDKFDESFENLTTLQITDMSNQKIDGLPDKGQQYSYADIRHCNSRRTRS